ncbi:MAG: hypothetical protein AABY32_06750 [Nanoarchaeota archaeon]
MKKNKKIKEKKIKKFKKIFNKKRLVILGIIILVIIGFFIIIKDKKPEINDNAGAQVQIYPLTNEQKNIVSQTILSSEFIKDLPDNGAIALQFYDFVDGQRRWQGGPLIGKDGFLSEGQPDIILIMHSKYISQLDGTNLCDIIKSAQTNGDLGMETTESEVRLLLKYSGMIKYRDCFGF